MTEAPFPALEDRPPFDADDLGPDEGPSERVAGVLAFASEQGFSAEELIELAIYCCGESAAELTDELSAEAVDPDAVGTVVEAITRLQVAAEILDSVDLGSDLEEEEAEEDEGFAPEDDLAA